MAQQLLQPPPVTPDLRPRTLLDVNGRPLGDDTAGFLLPHQRTFASIWNATNLTYQWTWDEAVKHSQENVLAMRRDAFIMGCLEERYLQLPSLKWHLEPEDSRNPRMKAVAAEMTKIVQRTAKWVHFVRQLCEAIWYGRYANHMNWQAAVVGGQPRLCVVDHFPVNGDKIQYGYDGYPRIQVNSSLLMELKAAKEDVVFGGRAPMVVLRDPRWRQRFIIHKHICDDADYFDGEMAGGIHGVGLRTRIYWLWFLRDEMLGWAVNHLKKIGVGGILIFYYEEGNAESEAAANRGARDAGERYALAMPRPRGSAKDTNDAKLLAFNESGVQALTGIISDYFERHIERLIIGQVLSSKAESTGLGSAVGALHSNTKFKILEFDSANLADTLTSDLVKPAQRWNFPQDDYQIRFVFDLPDPQAQEKMAGAVQLFQTGAAIKADEVRGLNGFSKPEPDDEQLSQAILMQQQQAIQLQAQQQQMQLQMQAQQAQQAQQMQMAAQVQQAQGAQPGGQQGGPQKLKAPKAGPATAQESDAPARYDAEHAPAGGISIGGKKFTGGEFIPGSAMARATPGERRKLKAKQQEAKSGKAELAPVAPKAEKAAKPQFVGDENIPDLMRFAATKTTGGQQQPILKAVYRLAKMTPGQFASEAGKAWQRAPDAAGFNEDVATSLGARIIHSFRAKKRADVLNAGEGEGEGYRKSLHPEAQKATRLVARRATVFVKPVAKQAIREYARAAVRRGITKWDPEQYEDPETGRMGWALRNRQSGELLSDDVVDGAPNIFQDYRLAARRAESSGSITMRGEVVSATANFVADILGEYFADYFKQGLEYLPQLLTGRKAPKRARTYAEDELVAMYAEPWEDEARADDGKWTAGGGGVGGDYDDQPPHHLAEEFDQDLGGRGTIPDRGAAMAERLGLGGERRGKKEKETPTRIGLEEPQPEYRDEPDDAGRQGLYDDEDVQQLMELAETRRTLKAERKVHIEIGRSPPDRSEEFAWIDRQEQEAKARLRQKREARRSAGPFADELTPDHVEELSSPVVTAAAVAATTAAGAIITKGVDAIANRLGEKTADAIAGAMPAASKAAGEAVKAGAMGASKQAAGVIGEMAGHTAGAAGRSAAVAAGTAASAAGLSAVVWPVAAAVACLAASALAGYGISSLMRRGTADVDTADVDTEAELDALHEIYGDHAAGVHARAVDKAKNLGLMAARRMERSHDRPTLKHWLVAGGLTMMCPVLGSFITGAMIHKRLHS